MGALGDLFSGKKPTVKAPEPAKILSVPRQDDEEARRAREKAIAERRAARGRDSTNLGSGSYSNTVLGE